MRERRIPTGASVLDELLEGGYETDAITTIYGPASAGKTNLALLAAVEIAKKGKKVVYVDTEGGFSVARLKQLCPNHKRVLQKIVFLNPTNFEEQKKAFEKLSKLADSKIGLIIVDTISMHYRLERKLGEGQDFNRELGLQLGMLSSIARKKNIPVLVTNQVYTSFENNRPQMIGGDILKYGSKCLIELQPLNQGKRKAVLRKHRSLPSDKEVWFEIVSEGITPLQTPQA